MHTSSSWLATPRIVCGLMSGTSLDGIDAALVRFSPLDTDTCRLELLSALTLPLGEELRELLIDIIGNKASVKEISLANTMLAYAFADAVRSVCNTTGLPLHDLDAVGSHGQTVWHHPAPQQIDDITAGSTFQIGSPSTIAQLLGVPVVGDFRAADVAVGGQGAPLVPIFDYHFLAQKDDDVIALNIGGMANITLLPAGVKSDQVYAFDTGPGNILIDLITRKLFGKRQDTNGSIAREGIVLPRLLSTLRQEPFITQEPPKSTGRELFTMEYLDAALQYNYMSTQPAEDAVRTVTEFTAWSIAENIRRFGNPHSTIIASGGGIHNSFLMEVLARELPEGKIITTDETGIPADAKEAMCFAYLAYRTLGNLPGNIPSVTGARKAVPLGVIAYP